MIEIDATNRSLGRVASEAAKHLMGKNRPDYEPQKVAPVEVKIVNAAKLNITEKKRQEKVYTHHTQYPGGLRETKLDSLINDKGYNEVVRRAVEGMLPSNRLRRRMLANLTIEE